jgi:hypothetical protein
MLMDAGAKIGNVWQAMNETNPQLFR